MGLRRVAPRRVGGPKFRDFHFSSKNFNFCALSRRLLVDFRWSLECRGPQKHPPKFNEKTPRESIKSEISGGRSAEGGSGGGLKIDK